MQRDSPSKLALFAAEDGSISFKQETVQALLKLSFKDPSTRVNKDAVKLTADLLKFFAEEAIHRAALQTETEDSTALDVEELEKILPQLLLDF